MVLTHVNYTLLPQRWSKHTSAASVQLGHNDVLHLVGRGAGGEVEAVRCVLLFRQRHQEVRGDDRFPSSCRPHKELRHLVKQVRPQEEELTCRLHRRNDQIRHLRDIIIQNVIRTEIQIHSVHHFHQSNLLCGTIRFLARNTTKYNIYTIFM